MPFICFRNFSELYGIPLDAIIGMGTAINPAIHSISGLVLDVCCTVKPLKKAAWYR